MPYTARAASGLSIDRDPLAYNLTPRPGKFIDALGNVTTFMADAYGRILTPDRRHRLHHHLRVEHDWAW